MHEDPTVGTEYATPRITAPPTYWYCEPEWCWLAPVLNDYLLWYVIDGTGWLELDHQHLDLVPGRAVVFTPGDQPHAGHDPARRLLVFGMHFDRPTPYLYSPVPPRVHAVRDQTLFSALAARCDRGHRRGDALGAHESRLCLEQMLCLLHGEIRYHPPTKTDLRLHEITGAIRQDPGHTWTVSKLARTAGLSPSQLTRQFRAHTGLTPQRFITLARIERASQLLAETTMTITQIATNLGYHDTAHFSRQYKTYTGHSPTHQRGEG